MNLNESAPGVFEYQLRTTLAGTYEVRFTALGRTLRNRAFTREAVRTGAVWIGGDQPPPSVKDRGEVGEIIRKLLCCGLSEQVIHPELRKRFAAAGFDIDALQKCIGSVCDSRSTGAAQDKALEQRLVEAVRTILGGKNA